MSRRDDVAAQGQLGPDFHQRDEDNIDASREQAAAQDRSDLPVEAHDADCPCESCEEFERMAGGSELVRDRIRVDAGQAAAALLAATTEHFDKFPGDTELGLALTEAVTSLCDLARVTA